MQRVRENVISGINDYDREKSRFISNVWNPFRVRKELERIFIEGRKSNLIEGAKILTCYNMAKLFSFPPREVDKMKMRIVSALETCARLENEKQRQDAELKRFYAK